jgi:hypothetical protein
MRDFFKLSAILLLIVGVIFGAEKIVNSFPNETFIIPEWIATRELILKGHDPYSKSTQNKIESSIYGGRVARSGEKTYEISNQIFALILLLPLAFIKDPIAVKTLYISLLLLTTYSFSNYCVLISQISKIKRISFPFILLVICSVQILMATRSNGFSIISSAFLVFGIFLIKSKKGFSAGIALALSAISPELSWAVLSYTIIWSLSLGFPRKSGDEKCLKIQ